MSTDDEVNIQINNIFLQNKINDLQKFFKKRESLNVCNFYLVYLFHFFQSAGIFVTTIATSYHHDEFIWIGIGLNCIATVINIYEHINNNVSKKMLNNIISIKNGSYVDEDIFIDPDGNKSQK